MRDNENQSVSGERSRNRCHAICNARAAISSRREYELLPKILSFIIPHIVPTHRGLLPVLDGSTKPALLVVRRLPTSLASRRAVVDDLSMMLIVRGGPAGTCDTRLARLNTEGAGWAVCFSPTSWQPLPLSPLPSDTVRFPLPYLLDSHRPVYWLSNVFSYQMGR